MSGILPINVGDLLTLSGVESARVEFKAGWDEHTTGPQVLRTICAFANDFQNLNGGYVVLGVREVNAMAELPPAGLTSEELEAAQKWIRGRCNTIDPVYQPVLSPEVIQDRRVLVIWAPGSQSRPHRAPVNIERGAAQAFWIRLAAETVKADSQPHLLTQLMQLTARVPFDDRRALSASLNDLRESKVREFLNDVRSDLAMQPDVRTMYRQLRASDPVNGHDAPRNVALLFFSQDPEKWFPGARIEVVHFAADASGDVLEEKVFAGMPIHEQLRECLAYLASLTIRQTQKLRGGELSLQSVSYPLPALREALVNAVNHRSYETTPEPIKVYLYPERMEIISYPGPVPGIEAEHLSGAQPLPPVPARNRRIGEWLKELRLAEGRGTGLPKVRRAMQDNGSAPPRLDFDTTRSYFRVTLPAHPDSQAIAAIQDAALLRAVGERDAASARLRTAWEAAAGTSPHLALEVARDLIAAGDLHGAAEVYAHDAQGPAKGQLAPVAIALASAHLDRNERERALEWLNRIGHVDGVANAFEVAIQEKRAGRFEKAHRYFALAGEAIGHDVKALHEFAQVKMRLAQAQKPRGKTGSWPAHNRLMEEARGMLERVTQMDAPTLRHAWAWFDLGKALRALRMPRSQIDAAFDQARRLAPDEARFQTSFSDDRGSDA